MADRICIIGNGCAAVETCRGLRESGHDGPIDVFAAGGLPAYNPMLTSYYAAGKIDYPLLFPYGDSNAVFDKYNVTLHPNTAVTALSAGDRTLTAGGEVHPFDKCCIATGASALVPPLPGATSPNVFTMRTVEDAVAVKKAMGNNPRRALVVGASMVGIKLVELFWKAKMEVTLADLAERIFPLAAHPDCSRVIEDRLEEMGVRLSFSAAIERIEEAPEGLLAFFKDVPDPLAVDIIMLCIGVRANLGFVNREEIEVRQGVLVNEYMESSAPGIYAAGDASQGMNLLSGQQVIGLWANARHQGFTAGCNMAGRRRRYAGEILHNITHFMGMDFVGIGDVTGDPDETVHNERWFSQIFRRDGELRGANFIDFYSESGLFKNALVKRILSPQARQVRPDSQHINALQEYLLHKLLAGVPVL